ncbi:zinc ribbon domain-containing protein [Actinospica robiniae]|uniref:zinc ribbon domain-containing protein n=1 Tax=Actinospica robiniae TaxID=304901 RepID=UPI0003FA1EC4|nr:C4-type zinc ribbon domain-containing protein [Actinospica robiniae]
MNAEPADQLRLLDLQALDSKLDQLAHRRRTLPKLSELATLDTRLGQLRDVHAVSMAADSDLAREQAKAEADVDQVRSRAERDRKLLESGRGSAKDLENLQHELESLAKRQSALEDVVLEVMEKVETSSARTAKLAADRAEVEGERGRVAHELAGEQAGLDKDTEFTKGQRELAAAGIPADLMALYEKLRGQYNGVGVAAIVRRRCQACQIELDIAEVNAAKSAPADAILRHDSCRRILVRTGDSGL